MSGLFSAAEMVDLRVQMEAAMTETATVKRRTTVSDGAGGTVDTVQTWTAPCFRMAEVAGAGDVLVGGQNAQGLRWRIYMPVGTDVRDADRVDVGDDTYDVVAVAGPSTLDVAKTLYALKR